MINSKGCLLTIVLFTLIFFFSFNINYISNEWRSNTTFSNSHVQTSNNKYKYLVVIGSHVEFGSRRELIRSSYFGIHDNLIPITPSQKSVQYAFCIHGDLPKSDTPEKRTFETEKMEYNDIHMIKEEFNKENVLHWVRHQLQKEKQDFSFDFLIVQDIHSFIPLDKLIETLEGSGVEKGQKDLVWGSDEKGFVIGSTAFDRQEEEMVLAEASATTTIPSQAWMNSVESVDTNSMVIFNVYQDRDFHLLSQRHLQELKREAMMPLDKSNAKRVVVTSSYIYDRCMEPSGTRASLNKRDYADKHNYAFVARSSEFAQQALRPDKRRTVWGKIDVIQKVLPKYEWLFWLDMDAVVMNNDISIDDLIQSVTLNYNKEGKLPEDIHFIIVRPGTDKMINAGVFLIKNTPWSFQFLQDIQERQEWYRQGPSYEQGAMWDVMRQDQYMKHTLFLDRENHIFNTFPKFYENDDFIVHFAPDKCPNSATLKGLAAADKIKLGLEVKSSDLL